jgi:hypothetical protein
LRRKWAMTGRRWTRKRKEEGERKERGKDE